VRLEKYTIRKGAYATKSLTNFRGNEHKIAMVFEQLLKNPALDTAGECVEWHKSKDEVLYGSADRIMVALAPYIGASTPANRKESNVGLYQQ